MTLPAPPSTVTDPKFQTVKEAATLLRVSKMTAYRLVRNGDLDHIRVGRSIRIPGQSISDYLATPAGPDTPAA